MSGKAQSKLKLSGNGNECKPLVVGGLFMYVKRAGTETCDTRFKSLQQSCLDITVGRCRLTLSNPR